MIVVSPINNSKHTGFRQPKQRDDLWQQPRLGSTAASSASMRQKHARRQSHGQISRRIERQDLCGDRGMARATVVIPPCGNTQYERVARNHHSMLSLVSSQS